jgi:hypothetical protein
MGEDYVRHEVRVHLEEISPKRPKLVTLGFVEDAGQPFQLFLLELSK